MVVLTARSHQKAVIIGLEFRQELTSGCSSSSVSPISKAPMMRLVELKKDIIRRIKAVESAELQTILELRYLSYMRWEEIAIELGYGIDNVFRLHRNALDEIMIPETIQ